MSLDLTVTDLFCGAGGSSIGATAAGATLRMAANHWQLAVDTHNANFPDADHDCADITQVDPRRYPTTEILIASPECTNHSQAKSNKHRTDLFNPAGDPAAERSRATMWDVIRFAERHLYQIVVVENVVEVMRWAPINAWLAAMESYGYRWRIVSLNSMTAQPTPQSRDRWYCVFWLAKNKAPDLEIRPSCWCPTCEELVEGIQTFKRPDRRAGKYRTQYLYRCPKCRAVANPFAYPAATAIDWTLPCPRIGDRERPLAPATRRRIEVGLERYGTAIVQAAGHTFERPGYHRTWSAGEPMPAQTTTAQHGVAVPAMYLKNYGSIAEAKYRAHLTDTPLGAITAEGDSHSLVTPPSWLVSTTRTHAEAKHRPPRSVAEPMATQTALPFMLSQYDYAGGDERRVYGVDEPAKTVVAGGNHHALVVPLRNNGSARPADEAPMPTLVAGNPGHALVASLPFTVDYHGNGRANGVDDPLPTCDTRDRHGLVEPAIEVDDCGFRMLEPEEIGRAMAFPVDYLVTGTKRNRVRLYGNAVTPPAMRVLLERCVESLS